ncbi:pyridine nucleotide-disulfide oxidoreductase [Murinocardiopsis flavida]|uniref:Pyridine nucleotide-disulfide oxidoreductase n=1 Tax=Murinocardiopsis flavida TaxID=645275 RepID=A0A2P8D2D5_9ACTN|nr:NAD(P)-binding domain-containing protein [Murinocardiopsis flavida]PSK91390.1 pyridine nucleotide-disulfide oxidoreductase [Murinocardiopsis flavida]
MRDVEVAVIGAGQAGLSGAYHLRRAGLAPDRDFVVLDHGAGPGGAWRNRWDTLTTETVNGVHDLPGMPWTRPARPRPVNTAVPAYFAAFERAFDLRVRRPVRVRRVREGPATGRLLVETADGTWSARGLINATGTWERPFWPYYQGSRSFRGRQLHTAGYRGAAEFAGQRVVVVGGGGSAADMLVDLVPVASAVTWVTRRPLDLMPGPFDEERGRASVAVIAERVRRGHLPGSVVSATGLALPTVVAEAVEDGRIALTRSFDRVTPEGVAWDDGRSVAADAILWATGFRPSVAHLGPLDLRERGGGIRVEGTRAVADPRVHLIGYGPTASTIGANRAGRTAVRELRDHLGGFRTATPTPAGTPAAY